MSWYISRFHPLKKQCHVFPSQSADICSNSTQTDMNFTVQWIINDDAISFAIVAEVSSNEFAGIGFSETFNIVRFEILLQTKSLHALSLY